MLTRLADSSASQTVPRTTQTQIVAGCRSISGAMSGRSVNDRTDFGIALGRTGAIEG
jgi:hypothetical protein